MTLSILPKSPADIIKFPQGTQPMDWYVIRSATRQEKRAVESLAEQGFVTYLPQGVRWGRLRPAKTKVSFPLFPGYLFVQCSPAQFRQVLETDGVHDFLCALNAADVPVPMTVSVDIIDGIKTEEARGVYDAARPTKMERERAERIARGYKKGERVVVLNGAYAGFMASVIKMTSRNRRAVIEGPNGVLTFDVEDLDAA